MPALTDLSTLIESIQQGDETAFRQLYELTKSRIFNTALSYVRSREDAEEITQDVFVDVFRSASQFKGDAAVTTWLYRITINKSLDFQKRKKRQKRFAFLTSLFDNTTGEVIHHPTDFFHPGVALENQENASRLFQAIDQLPDKQKTAYILTRIEGLTNIEAANVMTVTVGAVESLLQRANENLRKRLASWYLPDR
ncbi:MULTISPECIES: RNA polymerase sigma factor [unclassified Spirosoma]|uniref:RNA polymerase sigma factor n=1 Tax=unclassified Spirosoma TaxID=2621999 RepID=UPI0009663E9E|nr:MULTISPECIES: RNA polymerase sigma factor [unclassified Spirosoma]MBN8823125.1 RNA polymerase sigma factor [Spirosoma sp.]OJW73214.1 MAG: RNA polymerase subunit sigma-70 [Spirosoma sp. 48-14]